jgi:hypothetical protein
MSAGTLNLTIEQGTTFQNNMTANVDGSTNITTFTFASQIRTEAISDHVLATFTVTKTDKWDLAYVDSSDSSRRRLLEGNCTVVAQVTRS